MKNIYRFLALSMVLVMLGGCAVQVNTQPSTTATTTAATTTAATTAGSETTDGSETTAGSETTTESTETTEALISDFRFSSDPGSPNSREELVKTWPEFAGNHEAKTVCFEMGWTGMVAELDFLTPEIQKRTGFLLKYEPMITNSGEELNTKLNLMISSGEVPEIYFGSSDPYSLDVYEKLGQAGKLYDIGPYIGDYEKIYELLRPELIKYRRFDDAGEHNWFIPTQTGRGNDLIHNAGGGLYIRKDFLDILGIDYPTTMDEFVTYLERCRDEIKEVNGQTVIPLLFEENLGGVFNILNQFFPVERNAFGFDWDDNFKPTNQMFTNSDEFKAGLKLLNRLYREGLIDKEAVAMKREQYAQKMSSGRVASMTSSWWDMNTFSDNAKTDVPDIMYAQSKMLDVADYPAKHRKWTNWIGMYSTLTVSNNLDEDTLKHFLALLDYLATMDGQMLVQAGLPGKSFELDANGKYKFTDDFKKATDDLDWNKVAATGVYYWSQLVFNLPAFDPLRAEYPELVREDNYAGFVNREYERSLYDLQMMPPKDYYFDAGPIQRDKIGALEDARDKLISDCFMAKDEAEVEMLVDAYGAKCKELGIDEIMAERQQIIDSINIAEN